MKKLLFTVTIFTCISIQTNASTIGFDPDVVAKSFNIGETVEMPLMISGLGNHSESSLGAYDLTISYTETILDLQGVTFGDSGAGKDYLDLGSIGLEALGFAGYVDMSGAVELFEVSLDFISDLVAEQPDSFVIATLVFEAIGSGKSELSFISPLSIISDEAGFDITSTVNFVDGNVSVSESVPEPSSIVLILLGGLTFKLVQRNRSGSIATINHLE